jgi:hypothetical protein
MISRLHEGQTSVLCQKFAKEVGGLSSVMPAQAGIQTHSIFLDSGSRFRQRRISRRLKLNRQLARNDD